MGDHIVVEGLWQAYRPKTRNGWRGRRPQHWALRDVSLAVAPGETLGIVGGNGSGKTTLLQTVAGVLRPQRGTVTTVGRVSSLIDLSAGMHRELTGHENLLVGGLLQGLTRREIRESYDSIVAFSGLTDDMLESPLRTYSAGMGLRLGFAIVVHTAPSVLLVDEILAVGDESFQSRCTATVRSMRDAGCSVLLVSHDLDMVRHECDRVGVLLDGELVFCGDPDAAVDHYIARTGGDPDHGRSVAEPLLFPVADRRPAGRRPPA